MTSALSPCPSFEYKGLASNTFFSCSVTVIICHIFKGGLDNVLYHGHNLTILWDKNGDRYHCGKGLRIFVDGKEVGQEIGRAHV